MKDKITNLMIATGIIMLLGLMTMIAFDANAKNNKETPGSVTLFGKIRSAEIIPQDVLITVYHDGAKVKGYTIDEDGKFNVTLPLDGIYLLHISGYMMISKTVMIDTKVPAEFWHCEYEYKFNMNLTGGYQPEEDPGRIKQPVVRLAYNHVYDGFDYNREYNRLIQQVPALSENLYY